MANTVRLKRSAVQGKAPAVGDLALGELAVNTYDGKLYTKKNDGSDSIGEIGAGGGGVGEAPQDGAYYVRQNGQWVNEDEVLLYRYAINADGGDFEIGESRGAFVTLDPGDFDTGVSNGIDQTVDGGIFA